MFDDTRNVISISHKFNIVSVTTSATVNLYRLLNLNAILITTHESLHTEID
jgi:hypothetical protein